MKKMLCSVVCCLMFLSLFIDGFVVMAEDKYEGTTLAESGLRVRSGPGTSYDRVAMLPLGSVVEVVSTGLVEDEGGCENGWYKIYYTQGKEGYVCSDFLELHKKIEENTTGVPRNEYEKVLQEAGFPSTYWASLAQLHEKYPNWEFEAVKTGLSWNSAVAAESVVGKSLIQTSNYGYLSTADNAYDYLNNKFIPKDGSTWFAANSEVVAYYLDPRNFLNEKHIFMFEKLSYDESYQTLAAVEAVFGTNSYLKDYFGDFVNAGKTYSINPIYLASRVRQETGVNGGVATGGAQFTYKGVTYSGLYNLYNIGASSDANPVLKGLVWAGTDTTFNRPWTSIPKSIVGGAEFLASSYIGIGQYTTYLQRFNVDPSAKYPSYTHQYMTNIQAPASEAVIAYNSYSKMELLSTSFKFAIPVYEGMPVETVLPDPGHPNNHLKELSVNGTSVIGFAHDTYTYSFAVSEDSTSANVSATTIVSDATVSGVGEVALVGEETKVVVKVTAGNGKVQEYTVNIVKTKGATLSVDEIISKAPVKTDGTYLNSLGANATVASLQATLSKVSSSVSVNVKSASGVAKAEGSLFTGDVVTITNGSSTKNYTVVIAGDNNGDGGITIIDLLRIQKHLLGYNKLDNAYIKASDVDGDAKVTIIDLLKVQKHLLGYTQIV